MNNLLQNLDETFEYGIPSWISDSLGNIPENWEQILFDEDGIEELVDVYQKLDDILDDPDEDLSPSASHIFEFCRLTDLDNISVVIIGQDPYPNPAHAHGLAFSSLNKKIPASLKNIYHCLINTKCITDIPKHSDLSIWARRGVLLINAALTTKTHTTGKHQSIWKEYIRLVIEKIADYFSEEGKEITFFLWGGKAHSFQDIIDEESHHILKWRHPSPMAQNGPKPNRFVNCDHFRLMRDKINWRLKSRKIVAYTDGSAYPNKKIRKAKNGYAVIFQSGYLKKFGIYGSCKQTTVHPITKECMFSTSQRAEGMAVLKTFSKCLQTIKDGESRKWDEIEIITDSQFWINMVLLYMPKWAYNNKRFTDKANPDITVKMWNLVCDLKSNGKKISMRHVPSHGKDSSYKDADEGSQKFIDYQFNELADTLANHARKELKYDEHKETDEIY